MLWRETQPASPASCIVQGMQSVDRAEAVRTLYGAIAAAAQIASTRAGCLSKPTMQQAAAGYAGQAASRQLLQGITITRDSKQVATAVLTT